MLRLNRLGLWKSAVLGLVVTLAASCSSVPHKDKEAPSEEGASREPASLFSDGSKIHESDQGNALGLESVRFQYKSSTLTKEAKVVIRRNAQILKNYSRLIVQLEGNCDSKGSDEYNYVLGEKRARVVREFLIREGIPEKQLLLISYGKSRPLEAANTEVAQIKNRRTNFAILST